MNKLNLLSIIAGAVTLSSCMSVTSLNIMKPADVDLPSEIERLAIVQRNEAPKGKKFGKALEGVLSGEGIGTDKRSAGNAVEGFVAGISQSPKFTVKQAFLPEKLYGTGTTAMATPLSWDTVQQICDENGAQALVILETFDSDVDRDQESKTVNRTVDGKTVSELVFYSELEVDVTVGWRIYYPKEKLIIDNFIDRGREKESESGSTSQVAYNKLSSSEELIKREATQLGKRYAVRISPSYMKVTRAYYGKGDVLMKLAKTKVFEKNWEEAISIWTRVFEGDVEQKLKGKAAFNLAVGHEAISDFEQAIYWAKKAVELGNKKALKYLQQLENRKSDEERLKQQLEN